MRLAIRLRTVLLILTCWALADVLLYFGLEWETDDPTGNRRPSRIALSLFKPSLNPPANSDPRMRVSVPYRLMSPLNATPGVRYPLLVFLHGAGQKGDDNQAQLFGLPEQMAEPDWRNRFPCFMLSPQCPLPSSWTNHDDELIGLIRDLTKKHPIDSNRIYLTGLSMGGFGCWTLAANEPDLFAAVVPICGGGDLTSASLLINTPIWAVHGDADPSVPVERSRAMIAAIRAAGGNPNYTELKGVGHDSWTQSYRDATGILKWMFQQRNKRSSRSK